MKPFLLALALIAFPGSSVLAQDAKPVLPPVPPTPGVAPAATDAPVMDVDGHLAEPGRLPDSTTKAARERWEALVRASFDAKGERKPVTAFDLALQLRYRTANGGSNDLMNARYLFLAPDRMRAETGKGRAHLRGPKGDFLIDATHGDKVERIALVGRENAEDRRQLDEEVAIARNFVGLTDPRSLRVRRLVESAKAPAGLPDALKEDASKLAWLEIESPDLCAGRAAKAPGGPSGPRVARVNLGVDPETQLVSLAFVDDATQGAGVHASTVLLKLFEYKLVDGFRVPKYIYVYMPETSAAALEPTAPLGLRATQAIEMAVMPGSTLRANLRPEDFWPDARLPASGG